MTTLPVINEVAIGFIDLEASGLGAKSWPIEVGWAFPSSSALAMLIYPYKDWPIEEWDPAAERLHGVTYKRLQKKGHPIIEVCNTLNKVFTGKKVYSDAPDWDGFWLYRLFSAAGIRQEFSLYDYGELIGSLFEGDVQSLIEKASKNFPHSHRARDDVLHLKEVYRLAVEATQGG